MQSKEAADKSTERDKWNEILQGEEAAPLFPQISPRWPRGSEAATSRCRAGTLALLRASEHVCGLSWARALK